MKSTLAEITPTPGPDRPAHNTRLQKQRLNSTSWGRYPWGTSVRWTTRGKRRSLTIESELSETNVRLIGQRTQCALEAIRLAVLQSEPTPDVQPTDPGEFVRICKVLTVCSSLTINRRGERARNLSWRSRRLPQSMTSSPRSRQEFQTGEK